MMASLWGIMKKYLAAVVILSIIVLAFLVNIMINRTGGPPSQAEVSPPTATVVPTPPPTSQVEQEPTKPVAPSQLASSPAASALSGIGDVPVAHMVAIVRAFYTLNKDDTEATRRSRMAKVVPASVLKTLDLSVPPTSETDEFRRADIRAMQVALVNGSRNSIYVLLPIVVTQRISMVSSSGKVVLGRPETTTFTVSFNFIRSSSKDSWRLVAYTDGVNTS